LTPRADVDSLNRFLGDYPAAKGTVVYTGNRPGRHRDIEIAPIGEFLEGLSERLG
jgi:hypothetical protein